MERLRYWLILIGISCVAGATGCLIGGTPKRYNRHEAARAYAVELWPAPLELPSAPHHRARVLKARVYVDQAYRQGPVWRKRATHLIAEANGYLGPAFGVQLAAELVLWDRAAEGNTLGALLDELAAKDRGDDVAWVIGLVAAPPRFTRSHHELGIARLLGKHMIVRDMNDAEEAHAIDKALGTLEERDRIALYGVRKEHKQLVVFVHEWAHTLGAIHERADGRIMNPTYDVKASAFSESTARLIELGLALRSIRGDDAQAENEREVVRAKMRALLGEDAELAESDWWAEDRERLMVGLDGGTVAADSADASARSAKLPKAAEWAYRRAAEAMARDAWDEAWTELEPIAEAYGQVAEVQRLACGLAGQGVKALGAQAGCVRLLAIYAADPTTDSSAWIELAGLLLAQHQLSLADRALVRAGDDAAAKELAQRALSLRRRAGLPPDGARVGIPIEAEAEYLARWSALYGQGAGGELAQILVGVDAALERYPKAPGLWALRCGALAVTGKTKKAREACALALAGWEDAVLAHFFSAQLGGKDGEVIRHWERVVELDPEQESAWRALDERYRQAGRPDDRAALRKRFEERFGRPM